MTTLRIAVLMGGISREREISLRSGAQVAQHLDRTKYDVRTLDFTGDLAPIVALAGTVDVVFSTLHGRGGEDGRMQGVLDLLGLPYVGTGVLGSAMAMHKGVSKMVYREAGIPTPRGVVLTAGEAPIDVQVQQVREAVGVPCIVKPANEGSTIGIVIVQDATTLASALTESFRFDTDLVVEEFITGTVEISVPVLGTGELRALPAVEIVPQGGFYDYERKYTAGATEEICPARISATAAARAADYAIRAHRALQCAGISRTDMLVRGDELTVLETNTLPGMTETSLLPLAARTVGLSFAGLLDELIADARTRERA